MQTTHKGAREMIELGEKYAGHSFQSSAYKTPEFQLFASRFKRALKKSLSTDCELVSFNCGHFYVSGFIKDRVTGNYAYFSISDVRYFRDWHTNILIRTAKHNKDFTGGANKQTTLAHLPIELMAIAERTTPHDDSYARAQYENQ